MLNIKLTLSGGGLTRDILAHGITRCIHSQELLLLALPLVLLATGYNKQSTRIDKLSLRLGEGGSSINIIMMLSMTLTSL